MLCVNRHANRHSAITINGRICKKRNLASDGGYSKTELLGLAKVEIGHLPFKKMNKMQLAVILSMTKAAREVQRRWLHKRDQHRESALLVNTCDPISLEPLDANPACVWRFQRARDKVVGYNLSSIATCVLRTGKFVEPESRLPLSVRDVIRLDSQISKQGITAPSLVAAQKSKAFYSELEFFELGVFDLCRCVTGLIGEIFDILENWQGIDHTAETIEAIDTRLNEISGLLHQMAGVNNEDAKQTVLTGITFLKGPPNRNTPPQGGCLAYTISMLHSMSAALHVPG